MGGTEDNTMNRDERGSASLIDSPERINGLGPVQLGDTARPPRWTEHSDVYQAIALLFVGYEEAAQEFLTEQNCRLSVFGKTSC
jgi:hypothetical protein